MITNIVQILHTTAAYQQAVFHLMCGEANFAAAQLDLKEPQTLSIRQAANEWNVMPPATGVGGSVQTSNYLFEFQKGRVAWVCKIEWFKKISPPITNLAELASRPSLLDSNGAYQLATQWLSRLSVDVPAMERRFPPNVFQVPARWDGPDESNRVATPVYQVSWGGQKPPMLGLNPVSVKVLGTTKELLEMRIQDTNFFQRPPLIVTNSVELLGPLPPPRHFVEELVGGTEAYETINHPEQTEIWLLNSDRDGEEVSTNKHRAGPIRLKAETARKFSGPLLDFGSYAWTVQKLCSPDYGARLRFTRGKDSVEFLLCYECDILEVTHNGQTRSENFDYAHNKLTQALQAVFPRDNIVNKLKPNDNKPEDLLKMFQSQ